MVCSVSLSRPTARAGSVRLPHLRRPAALLPALHLLPRAGDAGQDLRPDLSLLPPHHRQDRPGPGPGHGHGHEQAQHGAGLPGRGRRRCQLRPLCPVAMACYPVVELGDKKKTLLGGQGWTNWIEKVQVLPDISFWLCS